MQPKKSPSQFKSDLGKCVGKRIAKLVRYSWWPKDEISVECGIADELSFSLTAGPLEVVFDDQSSLGIASDPGLNSVIVWWEREPGGGSCVSAPLDADDELHPVTADEEQYAGDRWRQLLNRQLIDIRMLKKRTMSSLESELPSELGLHFIFEESLGFIASHGLHDGTDDFSALLPDQLAESQRDQLIEMPL